MGNKKKFYFLPFLDNLKAIGITLLFMFIFGSWYANTTFRTIFTLITLLSLCGFIYSRMWKLSRRNTQRGWGLKFSDFIKFMLPLIIFDVLIIGVLFLIEKDVISLKEIVVKSYYTFPDNLPREQIILTAFDYVVPILKLWFTYLLGVASNSLVFLLAPVLSLLSALLGYKLGSGGKEIQNYYIEASEKVKKKFNE